MKQTFALETILIDKRYQARVKGLDESHVNDLMQAYGQADADINPPRVWNIPSVGVVLTRGFHRLEALRRLGRKRAECEVKNGDVSDALTDAASGNNSHGLKRTNADKRRSVEMVLEAHPDWSSKRVADEAGVGSDLVIEMRDVSDSDTSPPKSPSNLTDTLGRKQPARKPKAAPKPADDEKKEPEESDAEPVNEPETELAVKLTDVQILANRAATVNELFKSLCVEIDRINDRIDGMKDVPEARWVSWDVCRDQLKQVRNSIWQAQLVTDPYCKGHGKIDDDKCDACKGFGHVPKRVAKACPGGDA